MESRFTKARTSAGLTQVQLADRIGVSKATICNIESGARKPSVGTLFKLSEALGTTTDYLLGKTQRREEEPQRTTSSAASAHPSAPPGSLARR